MRDVMGEVRGVMVVRWGEVRGEMERWERGDRMGVGWWVWGISNWRYQVGSRTSLCLPRYVPRG